MWECTVAPNALITPPQSQASISFIHGPGVYVVAEMWLIQSQRGERSEHRQWDEHTHTHTVSINHYCTRTWRLAELVEDHKVMGVVEVLGQRVDVLTAQPVGHEDGRPVSVCPVDTILKHRGDNWFNTHNELVRVCVGLSPDSTFWPPAKFKQPGQR